MADEMDKQTNWRCPSCPMVIETSYDQMQMEILRHERRCPGKEVTSDK